MKQKRTLGELTLARSSHGTFTFNPYTGGVICTDLNDDFGLPRVVNVWEFNKHYVDEGPYAMCNHAEVDILDIGFIDAAGDYCNPEENWREEVALARRQTSLEEKYPSSDWRSEVIMQNTKLGLDEWRQHMKESNDEN